MKTLLITLLLLISTTACAIDSCYTGSWYDPARDGEGIVVEILGSTTVGYFNTFTSNGEQQWFTMSGTGGTLIMYSTELVSSTPFISQTEAVGTAEITPLTDDTLSYEFDQEFMYVHGNLHPCNGNCAGSYTYQRLTQPIPCP
jgi:hypothetical protein